MPLPPSALLLWGAMPTGWTQATLCLKAPLFPTPTPSLTHFITRGLLSPPSSPIHHTRVLQAAPPFLHLVIGGLDQGLGLENSN
jgi:hypothetical protein